MMSVKKAAEKLNVSASTVYTLVESGVMPHYRIGRAIRISEEQLAGYLEGTKREGAARKTAPVSKPRQKKKTYSHINLN